MPDAPDRANLPPSPPLPNLGHPAQLKQQFSRHRSYATLAAHIEERNLFEDKALNGVL